VESRPQGAPVRTACAIADCGDVDTVPISIGATLAAIDARVSAVIADGAMPVCVGGDHS